MLRVRRPPSLLLVLVTIAVAVLLAGAGLAAGLGEAELFLTPVLLLLGFPALGCYPGEEALAGALSRRAARPRGQRVRGRARTGVHAMARGGRLVAERLAGRAPPGLLVPA